MQANSAKPYASETTPTLIGVTSGLIETSPLEGASQDALTHRDYEPARFHGCFASCMEMYADAQSVAEYLDRHQEWFPRCAQPMTSEPIGENGYALTIGRFGSFGYEVEPKIGLHLLPQDHGIYRIQTIAVPNYDPPGYEVDFQASLRLIERVPDTATASTEHGSLSTALTRVEWELDLQVMIQFPRFIHALPKPLIQTTGDRLLNQIVRQVSRRLTRKVQEDFHNTRGIPFPKKHRKAFWQRGAENADLEE
ncbi:MAG: DUF1997 domain-containing protein [Synechococcales cyanobacterium M58_A2018_015]|nr:DUF1997 domain-containing protein [Synechococcales cyanobacterium M58_A2018_015]